MSNKNTTISEKDYEPHVERLRKATGCETIGELGKRLGYASGNAISNWKSRGLDYNVILEHYPTIRVKYLETGEGPAFYDEYEREFIALKDRIGEEGIPGNALDLLCEALQEDADRLQNDLQSLTQRIEKLRLLKTTGE